MSGRIPQSFIDDLLARVDIVEVIDGRVPLKKAGRDYTACCPFHSEKTPSFSVSQTKQFYHCFGCGAHGSAIGFLMDFEHLEFVEAIEELARGLGLEVPREDGGAARPADDSRRLFTLLEQADHYFRRQLREHPQAHKAVTYLKQRGLSGEIAARFGIGYAPPGWENLEAELGREHETRQDLLLLGLTLTRDDGSPYDRFRDRVMFPIRDRRGRVIGFGGRVLGDDKPKYLNSPESPVFHKGQELYGLFEARKAERKLERLLVVEGYMDVAALAQFGIGYAVATLGTSTTREHLDRLFRTVPEVVFSFDGDRAGREAAWRALENTLPVLQDGRQVRFLFLPEGEDPDSQVRKEGREAFERRVREATPLSEYLFEQLTGQVDMASLDGRARLVDLARPLLRQLREGAFRQLLIQRLGELAGMPGSSLAALLRGDTPPPAAAPERPVPRPRASSGGPSLVRHAICLLLHHPALGQAVQVPEGLADDHSPGMDLLRELLEITRERPHLTTGALLEHWRDREQGRHLHKLAATRLQVPEAGMAQELEGALARLTQQHRERELERLLGEAHLRALTADEKVMLEQLLSKT
ncbi:MAG: DNA primase [Gammaproteobacteria bacterium]